MSSAISQLLGKEMESRLIRTLIDNTPVAYIILDDKYRIHYINDNFLKLRKLDTTTTLGELCYNISNRGVPCPQCAVREALKTGENAFVARRDTLPDGTIKFLDDYAIPLFKDDTGKTQYVLEIMVDRSLEMRAREQRDADYDNILRILTDLLDTKDSYTATHSSCVREVAFALARAMGLPHKEVMDIAIAASLHDIGKIRIPNAIINKPSRLTDEEFKLIQQHPISSYEMIAELSSFSNIKNIVRGHHERYDGKGYPDNLPGEILSIGAKIVAVADTYDAMTSTRSYRKALSHEIALEEIKRCSGTQFAPEVVDIFLAMDFDPKKDGDAPVDAPNTVSRVLAAEGVKQAVAAPPPSLADIRDTLDFDRFIRAIFDNTPCGYVLMDTKRTVLFASQYFLDYMGLAEEDVLQKCCYDAAGQGAQPCSPCAVERALISGKVEYMQMTQRTNNGWKTFDLFGMPLPGPDGTVEYVIEIIIDRTDEVQLQKKREHDFSRLINMLTKMLDEQDIVQEKQEFSSQIISMREKLNTLLSKVSA